VSRNPPQSRGEKLRRIRFEAEIETNREPSYTVSLSINQITDQVEVHRVARHCKILNLCIDGVSHHGGQPLRAQSRNRSPWPPHCHPHCHRTPGRYQIPRLSMQERGRPSGRRKDEESQLIFGTSVGILSSIFDSISKDK
jgi:hypothetical protein